MKNEKGNLNEYDEYNNQNNEENEEIEDDDEEYEEENEEEFVEFKEEKNNSEMSMTIQFNNIPNNYNINNNLNNYNYLKNIENFNNINNLNNYNYLKNIENFNNIKEEFFKKLFNSNNEQNCSVIGGEENNTLNNIENNTDYDRLYILISQFMLIKGWKLFNKNGEPIKSATSFELFSFLTDIIIHNLQLKDYIIVGINNDCNYLCGDEIYLPLMDILSSIYKNEKENFVKGNNNDICFKNNFSNSNIIVNKNNFNNLNINNPNNFKLGINNLDNNNIYKINIHNNNNLNNINDNNSNNLIKSIKNLKLDNLNLNKSSINNSNIQTFNGNNTNINNDKNKKDFIFPFTKHKSIYKTK